jgi:hypothetical protein
MNALSGMTQSKWNRLSPAERDKVRDSSKLTSQLIGKEGCRVEVVDNDGNRRRFIVGKSTGWVPCHLELKNVRSSGGSAADQSYRSVRIIERLRVGL